MTWIRAAPPLPQKPPLLQSADAAGAAAGCAQRTHQPRTHPRCSGAPPAALLRSMTLLAALTLLPHPKLPTPPMRSLPEFHSPSGLHVAHSSRSDRWCGRSSGCHGARASLYGIRACDTPRHASGLQACMREVSTLSHRCASLPCLPAYLPACHTGASLPPSSSTFPPPPSSYFLHPTSYILHPTSYILHPTDDVASMTWHR